MTTQTAFAFAQSARERFERFHAANPHVYADIVALCRKARALGRDKWSAKAAVEVVRWNHLVRTHTDDYKINNDLTAHYSRLIMAKENDLRDFFVTRESEADKREEGII